MSPVSSIIENLVAAGKAYENNEPGAREALIDNSRALVTSLEIPSEFLQRVFWAEVSLSPANRIEQSLTVGSQLNLP